MPNLLCINPNTTSAVTEKIVARGREMAPSGINIRGATGRFGARYISTRTASAIAGHAALDAYASEGAAVDAVLLACFGDPGLLALRELATCPVIGLAEATCQEAAREDRRFSIITGGERWKPMLEEFVAMLGLDASLASIRTVAPTGGEIAANPQAAYRLLAEACRDAGHDDKADVAILGGAGLIGIADAIRSEVPIPVLCSVETGLQAAFTLLQTRFEKPESGPFALPPPTESIALSAELERLVGAVRR